MVSYVDVIASASSIRRWRMEEKLENNKNTLILFYMVTRIDNSLLKDQEVSTSIFTTSHFMFFKNKRTHEYVHWRSPFGGVNYLMAKSYKFKSY